MVDRVDPATRSRIMASIRGADTALELAVRKALHARGLRYRVHVKGLPGRPDIVFRRFNAVIFINGCFSEGRAQSALAFVPRGPSLTCPVAFG